MHLDEIELKANDGRIFTLRSLKESDAEAAIAHMGRIYADCPYMSRYADEWNMGVEDERLFLERAHNDEHRLMVGAFFEGRLVAIAEFSRIHAVSKMAHRCSCAIAIAGSYCGIGLGTAMMQTLIETAQRVGYEQMELEVVDKNATAIALYRKLGFVECGRLPRGFKNRDGSYCDLLSMLLILSGEAPTPSL